MSHSNARRSLLAVLVPALTSVMDPASAVAEGESLRSIGSPFAVDASAERLADEIVLTHDSAFTYAQLRTMRETGEPFYMTEFPLPGGRYVSLTLHPISVMGENAGVLVVKDTGVVSLTPQVLTFSGHLTKDRRTYAFLAVSPSILNGYFVDGDTAYYLSSGDAQKATAGRALLAVGHPVPSGNPVDYLTRGPMTRAFPEGGLTPGAPREALGRTDPQVRIADIFVECDPSYTVQFDSAEDAADYAITLFAAVSDIYRRDLGAELRIPDGYLRIWETEPPWGDPDLYVFIEYWAGPSNPLQNVDRALVHLLQAELGGGLAYLGGLCSNANGYATCSVQGYFPIPLQHVHPDNVDPLVLAHELGHNFGSPHTFDFNPPIPCVDGSGPDQGTIMSYCFLEIGMRFHARVQQFLRACMTSVDCLEVIDLTPGDYNHDTVLDELDLQAALTCINLEFEAAGCMETCDLDEDGRLTPCDYDVLLRLIDPGTPIEDCNENGQNDCGEIAAGLQEDCNGNGVPDECDIDGGTIGDCNDNGVPDDCEDCNENGFADECDIDLGTSQDCQPNELPDECDIADGTSEDFNENGIPDECDPHMGTIHVSISDPNCSSAGPGSEGAPFCDIQDAINASLSTDLALVADGTYTGSGNRNLVFGGRSITLRCESGPEGCIIDIEGEGRGFIFQHGETADSRLEGFTITNGYVGTGGECGAEGGGIHCEVSSPTISNCVISGNTSYSPCAANGGGISLEKSSATIRNCVISGNVAINGTGGGIFCMNSNPAIVDCVIMGNSAARGGGVSWNVTSGGGYMGYCPTIRNCTIVGNSAESLAGGVYASWSGEPEISSSILWGNTASSAAQAKDSGNLTISYSDIQDGWPGVGNINADPLFEDDYHLSEGSECIDAGDPGFNGAGSVDIDGGVRVWDGDGDGQAVVDIGADEFGPTGLAPIPTVSECGLIVMALLVLTAGTIVFVRRVRPAARR